MMFRSDVQPLSLLIRRSLYDPEFFAGKVNLKTSAFLGAGAHGHGGGHGHGSHGAEHEEERHPHGYHAGGVKADKDPHKAVTYYTPHEQEHYGHLHKLPWDDPWFKEDIFDPKHCLPGGPSGKYHAMPDVDFFNWEVRKIDLPLELRWWRNPLFKIKQTLGIHDHGKTPVQRFGDEYLKEQLLLGRPLSPHLTIYKPQLTSLLSITHRITGVAIGVGSLGLCYALTYPGYDFTCLIDAMRSWELSAPTWAFIKYLIAVPITYHYFNGVRFLAFEYAKGLDNIQQVYQSGWIVIALSIAVATLLSIWKGKHEPAKE